LALRPTRPLSHAEKLAQRDSAQQDVFLREVDDALREDEFFTNLKRYGKPVGAAVVLGLAALAGGIAWNSHRQSQKEAQAEQFVIALDKLDGGQRDAAATDLGTIAKDGGDGSATAAKLLQAAIAARKGDIKTAGELYAAVADDSGAAKPFRDLATVRGIAVRFSAMKPEDIVAKLKPLAAPGDPWFGTAGELLAAAYLKQGRKDLAGPLLVAIARDDKQTESLRARTRQLAGLLGFDAIDDIAKAPAAGGPPPPAGAQPAPAEQQPAQQPAPTATPIQATATGAPLRAAPAPKPTVPANPGPITVTLPAAPAPASSSNP